MISGIWMTSLKKKVHLRGLQSKRRSHRARGVNDTRRKRKHLGAWKGRMMPSKGKKFRKRTKRRSTLVRAKEDLKATNVRARKDLQRRHFIPRTREAPIDLTTCKQRLHAGRATVIRYHSKRFKHRWKRKVLANIQTAST